MPWQEYTAVKYPNTLYAVSPIIWAAVIVISVIVGHGSNAVVGLAIAVIGSALIIGYLMFIAPDDAEEAGGE